ncbi:unnamed protein product [Ixodes hexagonus]
MQVAEQVNVSASSSQLTAAEHTFTDSMQVAEQVNVLALTSQPTAAEHTVGRTFSDNKICKATPQRGRPPGHLQLQTSRCAVDSIIRLAGIIAVVHFIDCQQTRKAINLMVHNSESGPAVLSLESAEIGVCMAMANVTGASSVSQLRTTDHSQVRPFVCHQEIQWEDPCLCDHAYSRPTAPTAALGPHGGHTIEARDIFYTGLHADVFMKLVKVVPEFATTNFMMSVEQHVLLTLMKLRLGLVYGDLSRRFGVSVSTVGNIFRAMLATLGRILRNVDVWLSRETVFRNVPQSFEENGFAGTTCILDCTEVFLQRPKNCSLEHRPTAHTKATTL